MTRDSRHGSRRWIGALVCALLIGLIGLAVSRLTPRSPAAILILCVLAVLTMKVVEHRVHQWFRRWERR